MYNFAPHCEAKVLDVSGLRRLLYRILGLHHWRVAYLARGPVWTRKNLETGETEYREMTQDEREDALWMWAIR